MAKRMLATVDYVTPTGVLHLYRGASFLRQPLDRLVASHRCSSSSSSSSSSSFSSSSPFLLLLLLLLLRASVYPRAVLRAYYIPTISLHGKLLQESAFFQVERRELSRPLPSIRKLRRSSR